MIAWRSCTKWTRIVPHDRAEDYARLGWALADAFEPGGWHAEWCVLAAWLCDCPIAEPAGPHSAVKAKREQ
jgi:hypothetical protein